MISGNIEKFLSPVRTISGKVEVVDTSTEAQTGEAVRLEGCSIGAPLDVKLTSSTISDFTDLGTRPSRNIFDDKHGLDSVVFYANATDKRTRYGFIFDAAPGTYTGHVEVVEFTSASVNIFVLDENNVAVSSNALISYGNPYTDVVFTVEEGQHLGVILSGTSFTKEEAENIFYNCWNTQIELGNLPTPYEPCGEIQLKAEVVQYGKNIFDYTQFAFVNYYWNRTTGKLTSSSGYSCNLALFPVEHLQGKTITLNRPISLVSTNASGGTVFFSDNTKESFITGASTLYGTIPVPSNAKWMGISIPRAYASGEEVQIELGENETEYEAYKQPKVFKANAGGIVSGITAYSVNTLLVNNTGSHDVTVTASYSVEVRGSTFTDKDKIKSIQLDRVGENKFFGFGICQKATLVLVDKDCTCGTGKGDKFSISFDDVRISPSLYITDVARDENTNDLTLTAYDAIEQAAARRFAELGLTSYTIRELAEACATLLKTVAVCPPVDAFNLSYIDGVGANFDGSETIREVLNAIAEATQTIYYINRNDELIFKRLSNSEAVALAIGKNQYFTLDNKSNVVLTDICSVTELGDNSVATTGKRGEAQNIYDNPLLELRDDLAQLLLTAVNEVGDTELCQYNLDWRGNYLLELGDKISITTKMDELVYSYLLNDTITYNGGYKQVSKWEFSTQTVGSSNPVTLGDAFKQTYAKVDKANKRIDLVVSETAAQGENIAQLQLDTDEIMTSVTSLGETTTTAFDGINEELAKLTEKTSISVSKTEVEILVQEELSNGVSSVDTGTGFTFNKDGLTVSKSDSDISTTITEDGMQVHNKSNEVLTANNEGVKAIDLHATTYLIIGKNSRFEDYDSNRTACFWIGG